MDVEPQDSSLPYTRLVAVGAAINATIWIVDGMVPARVRDQVGYRRLKSMMAPILGALVGLVPDLLSSGHWLDRMIFGAMVGGTSTAAHNSFKPRTARSTASPDSE